MGKARTILVPIDFSEVSKKAVRFVLQHHYDDNARVVLIHTYRLITEEFSPLNDSPFALKNSIEEQLRGQFEKFSNELELTSYANVEFLMEVGFLVNCLRSICKESPVHLIAYGLKNNRSTQALSELIDSGCTRIIIIPNAYDENGANPNQVNLSQKEMIDNPNQYLNEKSVDQITVIMVEP